MKRNVVSKRITPAEINRKAVSIAAEIMERAGLCLYENRDECEKEYSSVDCELCIGNWLLFKAKQELKANAELVMPERRKP